MNIFRRKNKKNEDKEDENKKKSNEDEDSNSKNKNEETEQNAKQDEEKDKKEENSQAAVEEENPKQKSSDKEQDVKQKSSDKEQNPQQKSSSKEQTPKQKSSENKQNVKKNKSNSKHKIGGKWDKHGKGKGSNSSQKLMDAARYRDFGMDMEKKVKDLAGVVQRKASWVRKEEHVNWQTYLDSNSITQKEYSFINALQYAKKKEERDTLVHYFKDQAYQTIAKLPVCVQIVSDMRRVLVLIDDFLLEDKRRIAGLNENVPEPWSNFVDLLTASDSFVRHMSSRIMAKLVVGENGQPSADEIMFLLVWFKEELREDNECLISVSHCLQKLLQVDGYRLAFNTMGGVLRIVRLLSHSELKPQVQYQLIFCIWVTTFNSYLAEKMNRCGLIPVMMEVLERCPAESVKLPRVSLAAIRNLLEKPKDKEVRRYNGLRLIQCKMIHLLEIIEERITNANDQEFSDDYKTIKKILNTVVSAATSFEEYSIEIQSGRLEWSVVHTSKRFWVENAEHLNDNNYALLKVLLKLLSESRDNTILSIAAHDIGEYMKQYGRGKKVIEELGGKHTLLKLLACKHPSVRYHALKTLQILMLQNYENFDNFEGVHNQNGDESNKKDNQKEKKET